MEIGKQIKTLERRRENVGEGKQKIEIYYLKQKSQSIGLGDRLE
jgi:hypothetical protein